MDYGIKVLYYISTVFPNKKDLLENNELENGVYERLVIMKNTLLKHMNNDKVNKIIKCLDELKIENIEPIIDFFFSIDSKHNAKEHYKKLEEMLNEHMQDICNNSKSRRRSIKSMGGKLLNKTNKRKVHGGDPNDIVGECAMCLDSYTEKEITNRVVVPLHYSFGVPHMFHKTCLDTLKRVRHLRLNGYIKCPLCVQEIIDNDSYPHESIQRLIDREEREERHERNKMIRVVASILTVCYYIGVYKLFF